MDNEDIIEVMTEQIGGDSDTDLGKKSHLFLARGANVEAAKEFLTSSSAAVGVEICTKVSIVEDQIDLKQKPADG